MHKFEQLLEILAKKPNSKVLVRVDYNLGIYNGKVVDQTRIDKSVKGIQKLLKLGIKVVLISHFGRPVDRDQENSLSIVANILTRDYFPKLKFLNDDFGQDLANKLEQIFIKGESNIVLLENLRFDKREKSNDVSLIDFFASIADYYVFDAFSVAHRKHCSVFGLVKKMNSFSGPMLEEEIRGITIATSSKARPSIAIIGGAKISTKLPLLLSLKNKCDYLLIGGAMANTVLKAQGYDLGLSLVEDDCLAQSLELLNTDDKHISNSDTRCNIILPKDFVCKNTDGFVATKSIGDLNKDDIALDIGSSSVNEFKLIISKAKTIIWNGPLGLFEESEFSHGSISIAKEIAKTSKGNTSLTHGYKDSVQDVISVAGGGETIAVIKLAKLEENFSYVSSSGGAFIEFVEGRKLPALVALNYY